MKLSEIRQRILENLDDVDGDVYASGDDTGRIDAAIEDTLQTIAVIAEDADSTLLTTRQALIGETFAGGTAVTPAIGQDLAKEWVLPTDFRRLISMERMLGGEGVAPYPVQIIDQSRLYYYRDVDNNGDVGYIRYDASAKRSYFGFAYDNVYDASKAEYVIAYAAGIASLDYADPEDTPQLPAEYHHLIATGATVRLLMQENADHTAFQRLYEQGVQLMTSALQTRSGKTRVRP